MEKRGPSLDINCTLGSQVTCCAATLNVFPLRTEGLMPSLPFTFSRIWKSIFRYWYQSWNFLYKMLKRNWRNLTLTLDTNSPLLTRMPAPARFVNVTGVPPLSAGWGWSTGVYLSLFVFLSMLLSLFLWFLLQQSQRYRYRRWQRTMTQWYSLSKSLGMFECLEILEKLFNRACV